MKTKLFILSIIIASITKQSQAQVITTVVGTGYGANNFTGAFGGDSGQATGSYLYHPHGIVFDASGNMYIADADNNRIRKVNTAGIITTIAGNGIAGYSGDGGQATDAELNNPYGLAIDTYNNIYIADELNNRIRKINIAGIISTIAGDSTGGYSGDNGPATAAELNWPTGITFDTMGNLYIADQANGSIRMVNSLGIITSVPGVAGLPLALVFDVAGNLYIAIADGGNNVIQMLNTAGFVSTFAGGGSSGLGDGGQATNAELDVPTSIVFDASGNLYIADKNNQRIRKVNTSGIISTVAGNGYINSYIGALVIGEYSGDGGFATAAELNQPTCVALDALGNLYISDNYNNRIRIISPSLQIAVNSPAEVCAGINDTLKATGANTYSWSPPTGLNATTGSMVVANPSVTTTYTVTGFKGDSIGLATSVVTINAITVTSSSICIGDTATLIASGANSYTWSTGATTSSISISPTVTTTYTITGADTSNNCHLLTSITQIVISCSSAGIEQVTNSNELTIYPNPNNGTFIIEPNSATKQTIQIYDVNGKLVLSQTITGKTSIDVSNLNEGIYNLSLISNEGLVNKRIVIVK